MVRNALRNPSFDVIFASLILAAIATCSPGRGSGGQVLEPGPGVVSSGTNGAWDGKPFPMLKFRSMVQNADSQVASLMAQNDGAGVLFKMRDDPRVTPVGRFLRRYSIDELPQFVNVLRREMSVGRPQASASPRGRGLRRNCQSPTSCQAGDHRIVAGQWTIGPFLGRDCTTGPFVRRQLVADG